MVLLHGITASGDVFGAGWDPLGADGHVVIPDILGFGRSMDESASDFSLDAHLRALEEMLVELALDERSLTLVGHSLGGLLALHWAARSPRVERVVALCAPLYASAVEADERIAGMGWLERAFALEGRAAETLCAWMCRHRTMAAWLMVALEPTWPVIIARYGVRHTWASYLGAMNGVIRRGGWEKPLRQLEVRHVPVVLADGALDRVPVPGRAAEIAATHGNVRRVIHPTADHELPITHPVWSLDVVRR
ncbi:MAG: alpha/beta hydrolase [Actinomycetota bacterium]|nr:alpha/beta hydrolase [Actinomycetota bacterium]